MTSPASTRSIRGTIVKRIQAPLAITFIAALSLTGCGAHQEPEVRSTQSVELSWADGASSKGELVRKADAIVVGTVQSTEVAEMTDFGPLTDATISVDTWAKSKDTRPDEITIRQTGGVVDGVFYEVEDDPLLQVGEKGVFFVRYDGNTGVYVVLGGPTGRFKVNGDEAVPLPNSSIAGSKKEKLADLVRQAQAG